MGPLFSRSVARPRGHRTKKGYGVYNFPGKTREKGMRHRSGKKGIHHRASDPEKEKKEGFHGGGVYFLGHNLNQWAQKRSNFQFFPNFIVKMTQDKPPHLVWGFFTFQCFVFFLIFAFSCLSCSSFPLLLDLLKPKSGPSNEVMGTFFFPGLRAQRLKNPSISLENFNLDWNFQSWPSEFPTKNRGLLGVEIEIFNLEWKFQSRRAILNFFNLWALRVGGFLKRTSKKLSQNVLKPETTTHRTWAKGASHEKLHAAPSKKQACFLEGPLPLEKKGKRNLLRTPPPPGFQGLCREENPCCFRGIFFFYI